MAMLHHLRHARPAGPAAHRRGVHRALFRAAPAARLQPAAPRGAAQADGGQARERAGDAAGAPAGHRDLRLPAVGGRPAIRRVGAANGNAASTSSSISVAASSSSRSIWPTASRLASSSVRSRMSFCAASGSFQSVGSSDFAFSSASRRVAVSTSKMPPQQPDRLLDIFDELQRFGAHGQLSVGWSGARPLKCCRLRRRGAKSPCGAVSPPTRAG